MEQTLPTGYVALVYGNHGEITVTDELAPGLTIDATDGTWTTTVSETRAIGKFDWNRSSASKGVIGVAKLTEGTAIDIEALRGLLYAKSNMRSLKEADADDDFDDS